ncbi:MAG: Ig-like domain-containing protein [Gemmatimonadaceae bacterium]
MSRLVARRLVARKLLAGATLALALAACGDDDPVTPPTPVASITIAPPSPGVGVGGTVQLTATTKDAAGNTLANRTVAWSSLTMNIATVNAATGLVTGVAAGTATIRATSEGVTNQVTVTVAAAVATITITPDSARTSATIGVGENYTLTATLRDAQGNTLTGRAVTYESSNQAIATVSTAGVVTGVSEGGPVTITVRSEGQTATATIRVLRAFVLTQVNGQNLPAPLPPPNQALIATSGRVILYPNGRYSSVVNYQGSAPNLDAGTYTQTGTSIVLRSDTPPLQLTGTLSGNTLTLPPGFTFVRP